MCDWVMSSYYVTYRVGWGVKKAFSFYYIMYMVNVKFFLEILLAKCQTKTTSTPRFNLLLFGGMGPHPSNGIWPLTVFHATSIYAITFLYPQMKVVRTVHVVFSLSYLHSILHE